MRVLMRGGLPDPVATAPGSETNSKQEKLMNYISMIARACQLLIVVSAIGFVAGIQAQTPTPTPTPAATPQPSPLPVSTANPADVATMDAIVAALYDVISGPPESAIGIDFARCSIPARV
jgi:hypothetical protein